MTARVVKISGGGRETVASLLGMRCEGLAPSEARTCAATLNAGRGPGARSAGTRYEVKEESA